MRSKTSFLVNVISGLLCVVKLSWNHSDSIGSENIDSLMKLKMNVPTEAAFLSYFEMGMSVSEAKAHHKLELKNQPDYLPGLSLIDSSINPKDAAIAYLYDKWRHDTQGGHTGINMLQVCSQVHIVSYRIVSYRIIYHIIFHTIPYEHIISYEHTVALIILFHFYNFRN